MFVFVVGSCDDEEVPARRRVTPWGMVVFAVRSGDDEAACGARRRLATP
jgi:hypothetical protein